MVRAFARAVPRSGAAQRGGDAGERVGGVGVSVNGQGQERVSDFEVPGRQCQADAGGEVGAGDFAGVDDGGELVEVTGRKSARRLKHLLRCLMMV
jgi:hypothetical protein